MLLLSTSVRIIDPYPLTSTAALRQARAHHWLEAQDLIHVTRMVLIRKDSHKSRSMIPLIGIRPTEVQTEVFFVLK